LLHNCIASILLASIDTTIKPISIVDKLTLLVELTRGQLPQRATSHLAGLNLYTNNSLSVPAHGQMLIPLKIKIALLLEIYRQITSKSKLALKGIDVGADVINADYQGELQVLVINHTNQLFAIYTRDRIAQLIVEKIAFSILAKTKFLKNTLRKANEFGSIEIATIDLGLHKAIVRHISEYIFGKNIHNAITNQLASLSE
jgi:dUTP pyrophosphatase